MTLISAELLPLLKNTEEEDILESLMALGIEDWVKLSTVMNSGLKALRLTIKEN